MDQSERLTRLAALAVGVGANVQPGQRVVVTGLVEQAPLIREISRAAYRAGAAHVDALYTDRHLTRAHVELGPEATLSDTPPWIMTMLETLDSERGAYIQVHGEHDPELLADLDGRLVGKAQPLDLRRKWSEVIGRRTVAWTIVAGPTPAWAKQVFGKPDVDALWGAIEKAVRLDADDPVAAWRAHVARLRRIADALNERRFEAVRYKGPGTDFTVGLLPSSLWDGAETVTTTGVAHVANIPTEEIYTSPDRRKAEGRLRSTRPLQMLGAVVRDLELEFRDGRIVEVNAATGADVVRAELASDPNAVRLGEVSLVDGSSAVGRLGLTFYDTLFDENATCHIAYGAGFEYCVTDAKDRAEGLNESSVHRDFMVGGPDVQIDGREPGGAWIPILHDNEFRIR